MKNIKDWNRNEILGATIFHFKNSSRPFICADYNNNMYGCMFVDLSSMVAYSFEELEDECLAFYTKEDDENFLGVEVVGVLKI